MSRRPQLTVRARLTLLYTVLFALCGAVVVWISYFLVAQSAVPLAASLPESAPQAADSFAAMCQAQKLGSQPDKQLIAKCIASFQQQGAQAQFDLILSHLLLYSLITLAVVIAVGALLGWILAGRTLRPLHQITAAARAASEHNLSARVNHSSLTRGRIEDMPGSWCRLTRCVCAPSPIWR